MTGTTTDPDSTRYWLDLARQGTGHYDRVLADLADDDLNGPSLLDGWSRKHVVGHVAYNAFALTRLTDWGRTGVESRMYASTEQRNEEIETGATLEAADLRDLHARGVRTLDEGWDSLSADAWAARIVTAQGVDRPVSDTPWMRSREVWIHAVDLDAGATFADIPPEVLVRLVEEIWGLWSTRNQNAGLALAVTGHDGRTFGTPDDDTIVVSGPLAVVTRWAAGRGQEPDVPVFAQRGGERVEVPAAPPRWL